MTLFSQTFLSSSSLEQAIMVPFLGCCSQLGHTTKISSDCKSNTRAASSPEKLGPTYLGLTAGVIWKNDQTAANFAASRQRKKRANSSVGRNIFHQGFFCCCSPVIRGSRSDKKLQVKLFGQLLIFSRLRTFFTAKKAIETRSRHTSECWKAKYRCITLSTSGSSFQRKGWFHFLLFSLPLSEVPQYRRCIFFSWPKERK